MGAGIAICFLMKNIPVILKEVNEKVGRSVGQWVGAVLCFVQQMLSLSVCPAER